MVESWRRAASSVLEFEPMTESGGPIDAVTERSSSDETLRLRLLLTQKEEELLEVNHF
jgi:hypothetical protein